MSSKVVSGKGEEPKYPLSSYFLWLQANREEVRKQFPMAKKSFTKRAGGMWRKLEDKSHWEDQARKAKRDYEKAMEEYEKGAKFGNKRKQPAKKVEDGKKTKKGEENDETKFQ